MRLLIVGFLLFGFQVFANPVLEEVRSKFPFINSKEQSNNYILLLEGKEDIISQGYLAAMYFFYSKYVKFPTTKFKYFKKGKVLLNRLIESNPANAELRYIRFIFQHQIPKFLGYNKHKDQDFMKLIKSNFLTKDKLKLLISLNNLSIIHLNNLKKLVKE